MKTEVAIKENTAVAIAAPSSLLDALTAAASNPDTDIGKMERLFAMHQQMVAQQAEVAFNTALAHAQAKIVPIVKNKFNDQTRSAYANLAAVNEAILPVYTAEGLSVSFDTDDVPNQPDEQRTIAILSHSGGHSRRYHIDLPADGAGIKGTANKTAVHAYASSNSYARRYLVCMIFNVSTIEDDGNGKKKDAGTLDESKSAEFDAALSACKSAADVAALWKTIAAECHEAKDKEAHADFKGKVTIRISELKGAV